MGAHNAPAKFLSSIAEFSARATIRARVTVMIIARTILRSACEPDFASGRQKYKSRAPLRVRGLKVEPCFALLY